MDSSEVPTDASVGTESTAAPDRESDEELSFVPEEDDLLDDLVGPVKMAESHKDDVSITSEDMEDRGEDPWKHGDRWTRTDSWYRWYLGDQWDKWKMKRPKGRPKPQHAVDWKASDTQKADSVSVGEDELEEEEEAFFELWGDQEEVEEEEEEEEGEEEDEDELADALEMEEDLRMEGGLNMDEVERSFMDIEHKIRTKYGLIFDNASEESLFTELGIDDLTEAPETHKSVVKERFYKEGPESPDVVTEEKKEAAYESESSESTDSSECSSEASDDQPTDLEDEKSESSFISQSSDIKARVSFQESDDFHKVVKTVRASEMITKTPEEEYEETLGQRWHFGLKRPPGHEEPLGIELSEYGLHAMGVKKTPLNLAALHEKIMSLPGSKSEADIPDESEVWHFEKSSVLKPDVYSQRAVNITRRARNLLTIKGMHKFPNIRAKVDVHFPEARQMGQRPLPLDQARTWADVCPERYVTHNNIERVIMWKVENFRNQFSQKFPDRLDPYLVTKNECGVQKFLPWMIRPTSLAAFPFLEDLVNFVVDHITYVPLAFPLRTPDIVCSPSSVLLTKKGNCMEMSILMVSLLRGLRYDAYVAWGYADKETCTYDLSEVQCDYTIQEQSTQTADKPRCKYELKERPLLQSEYDNYLNSCEEREEARMRQGHAMYLKRITKMLTARQSDRYHGQRRHAWVVVVDGRMLVETPFFIEPSTGNFLEVDSNHYLGIESMFNEENVWVNLQDITKLTEGFTFDTKIRACWMRVMEPMFEAGAVQPSLGREGKMMSGRMIAGPPKLYFHPSTWQRKLKITADDRLVPYPGGRKRFDYNQTILLKFAPYSFEENMLVRAITYRRSKDNLRMIRNFFGMRKDKLTMVEENPITRMTKRYFSFGRPDLIEEHHFPFGTTDKWGCHKLVYNLERGLDGLVSQERTPNCLIKEYQGRPDRMNLQIFDKGPLIQSEDTMAGYPVLTVIERFDRDPSKTCHEDIAEITFNLLKQTILFSFHQEEHFLTTAWREYRKPPMDARGMQPIYTPESTFNYRPRLRLPMPSYVDDYQTVFKLQEMARRFPFDVRLMEEEFADAGQRVMEEGLASELYFETFDIERNLQAQKERRKRDRDRIEAEFQRLCRKLDIIGPYWEQMHRPSIFAPKDSMRILEKCLGMFRLQMMKRVESTQEFYNHVSLELYLAKSAYEDLESVRAPTEEEVEDYKSYCHNKILTLKVAEDRCKRLKYLAAKGYEALIMKLVDDPRLQLMYRKGKAPPKVKKNETAANPVKQNDAGVAERPMARASVYAT